MNIRNLFNRYRKGKRVDRLALSLPDQNFTSWGGNAYENDVFRSGVDAIARNASKFILSPVKTFADGSTAKADARLTHILQVEPNPIMTAYDLIYKMVTRLYIDNNSFVFVQKDSRGRAIGLYPLTVSQCEIGLDGENKLVCRVNFPNGKVFFLPYSDVIHLRRHFNRGDAMGDPNTAIEAGLELAHTQNEGIINSTKYGSGIRGILHYTQILSPEKLKENTEAFIESYLNVANSGGVAATDQSMEFKPMDYKTVIATPDELQETKTKIYNYLGITEPIVNSSYNDDQWSAFNESVLDPLAFQITLEATRKIFTPAEIAEGYEVQCTTGRLQFISNANKIQMIKETMPLGIITVDQALEILGLPVTAEGDRRMQSLNYIDQSIANEYQLTKAANMGNGTAKDDDE